MKKYFSILDDLCYSKDFIIDEMKINGMTEINVSEATRETGSDYFFCQENLEVGTVGEYCGKQCNDYKPRNGKSGCCKNRGFCYEPGHKFILSVNGKLKPVENGTK